MMLHFVFFSRFFRFFLLMFYYFFLFRFFRRFLLLVFCRKFFFVFINKYTNRLSTPCEFTPNWNIFDTICILHLRNWFFLYWFITNLFVFAVVTVRWMLMLWRLFVVDDNRLYFLLNLCVFFFFCIFFYIYIRIQFVKNSENLLWEEKENPCTLEWLEYLIFFPSCYDLTVFVSSARFGVFFFSCVSSFRLASHTMACVYLFSCSFNDLSQF